MDRLLDIALRANSPMQEFARACVTPEAGIEGDFRGKSGEQHVALLARTAFEVTCTKIGVALPWAIAARTSTWKKWHCAARPARASRPAAEAVCAAVALHGSTKCLRRRARPKTS